MMAAHFARLERHLVDAVRARKPKVPEAGKLIWEWFCDLSQTRAIGMVSGPISFAEIEAYARLHRLPLQSHHVRMIRAMDRALLDRWRKEGPSGNAGAALSQQPVTPALFDAMFS